MREKLTGTIEVDETYIGGKVRGKAHTGRGTTKTPVAVLVQCNGEARSWDVERVTIANLKEFIGKNVDKKSAVMTNDFKSYKWVKNEFARHGVIPHDLKQYVKGEFIQIRWKAILAS